eukprot:g1476.t1
MKKTQAEKVTSKRVAESSAHDEVAITAPNTPDRRRFRRPRLRSLSGHKEAFGKLVVLLDLDLTLIHMLKRREFPLEASRISERTLQFVVGKSIPRAKTDSDKLYDLKSKCAGEEFSIAIRFGASQLVRVLRNHPDVHVRIVTANVFGKEIVEEIANVDSAWKGISTFVAWDRSASGGYKTYQVAELPENLPDLAKIIILDDTVSVWDKCLRPFVWHLKPFNLLTSLSSEDVRKEKTYLARVLSDVLENLKSNTPRKESLYVSPRSHHWKGSRPERRLDK